LSLNCYLIDKKGYRDKIFFQEKGCGFKKYMYFCGVKMTKRNDRFCYQNTKVNTCTLLTRVHIYRTNISIIVLLILKFRL